MGNGRTSGLTKRGRIWHLNKQFRGVRIRESAATTILTEAVELVTAGIGGVAGQNAALQLPLPPVVVVIAALDLVGGGCRAPQEAVWEVHHFRFKHTLNVQVLPNSFLSAQNVA